MVRHGRPYGYAHNDKPETWTNFQAAQEAAQHADGIGLQLLGLEGFAAIDLDDVKDADGALLPWAADLVKKATTYSEFTPSGEGARIIGKVAAVHPTLHTKKGHPGGGHFEIYANLTEGHGRYITVTGDRIDGAPDALADISGIVTELMNIDKGEDDDSGGQVNGQPPFDFNAGKADLPGWISVYLGGAGTGDRSADFQAIVNALRPRGWSFEAALKLFKDHPNGPGAKYADRLETELRRSWGKASEPRGMSGTSDGEPRPNEPDEIDLSHDALATDLGARSFDRDARHVAGWGKWLFWTGTRWQVDDKRECMDRTRAFLRRRAEDLTGWAERKAAEIDATEGEDKGDKLRRWAKDQARTLRSKNTVAAIESLAQSNPASAARPDDFDDNRLLLGTPGGTVDLRTGDLRQAERGDMLTKLTACAPAAPGTRPERWLAFLHEIFDGDPDLVAFMQRAAGYALTGLTTEHKLLFLYGTGRNGKSVFLNTLFDLWGDYARRAAAETFLNTQGDKHATGLAGLQGARLVAGSELPKGKTWDESTIKDLTGGDVMTARYMRGDFFDFVPQLTLMIAGNNQPSFRGVDEAIRARVVLVPFTVTIPPEKRDKTLPEKLKAEAPEILRWAIDGALAWQERGLDVPAKVATASTEYMDDEDTLGQFLMDETAADPAGFVTTTDLHERFNFWCDRQGLHRWTANTLRKELKGRGWQGHRKTHGRGFTGLKLR